MVSINCTTEDHLELDQLTEFQGGLKNRTDGDYAKIIVSIQKYGFSFPFFVWSHDGINHVLDGHGRLGALKKLKAQGEVIPPLPVVYVNCGTEENAKNLLLRLNSQYGTMTAESVMEFMEGLEFDPFEIALPAGILDLNLNEAVTVDDDESPEPNLEEPAVSKLGEVYQLGRHTLMCGDSTKEEDVAILMDGAKADLVVTDPPYNVNLGQGGSIMSMEKRHRRTDGAFIQNDHMEDSEFYNFLVGMYTNIKKFTKEGGSFYVWHADNEGLNFRSALKAAGLTLRQTLIWNKNALTLGRQDYQWKHEPCLYGWLDGESHSWYNDRKQSTVIDCERPTKSAEHPTMKPVKLFEYLIKNSSKADDLVLDLFGGSGTTMIACQKTKRIARLMELDPHYCDVIRRRWTQWCKENGVEPGEGALE